MDKGTMTSNPFPGGRPPQGLDGVISAMLAGDYARAAQLANTVIALGQRHPILYNARGLAYQQQRQFREALGEFTQARLLAPGDPNIQNAIGVCLLNLNNPTDAIRAFETTIALDPANAQAHYRKGWTLEMLGERAEARKLFERAIELDANHADALASLAASVAVTGEMELAETLARRALAVNANQSTAIVALGMVDLESRNYAEAEKRFRRVIDDPELTFRARAVVHGLLADALDGLDRTDEAFAAYRFEKNEMRLLYAQSYVDDRRPREVADEIAAFLEASASENWHAPRETGGEAPRPAHHAFLLGFPRSGTTLLEQVLATSPQVVALEEQDLLADMAQTYLSSEAGLRRLTALSEQELQVLRERYWKAVGDLGIDVSGKTFLDKLPMHTIKLPLIARLFPDARIIFAMRDPRDVLLSCYRRHFRLNPVMFEFLTLDSAAELYASTMRLGVIAREKLPLAFHEYRYEDTIADFDTNAAAVCDFIGVEWSEAMRDFHRAETGLDVQSPSRAQIRRPLNPDSVNVWRRYREHLSPVLPLLRTWAERFGYPAE
jgi:tetratricopeptide (TPR) repeat protein